MKSGSAATSFVECLQVAEKIWASASLGECWRTPPVSGDDGDRDGRVG